MTGIVKVGGHDAKLEAPLHRSALGEGGQDLVGAIDVAALGRNILQPMAEFVHVVADLAGKIHPRLVHQRTVFAPARNPFERESDQHAGGNEYQMDEGFLHRRDGPVGGVNLHDGYVTNVRTGASTA